MADLLLEIFLCEEIPARCRPRPRPTRPRALGRCADRGGLAFDALEDGQWNRAVCQSSERACGGIGGCGRRAQGTEGRSPSRRCGLPEGLRGARLQSIKGRSAQRPKKGDFYVAMLTSRAARRRCGGRGRGRTLSAASIGPRAAPGAPAELRWVRPLQRILACWNGEICAVRGRWLASVQNQTEGHPGARARAVHVTAGRLRKSS